MRLFLLSSLSIFAFSLGTTKVVWHDIHISKCSIAWSDQDQSIDIQLHIFQDDLELALQAFGEGLPAETFHSASKDQLLNQYLKSKLKIMINRNVIVPICIDKSISDDGLAILINLKVDNIDKLSHFRVGYDVLMEIYGDQQNIVHVKGPEGKQAYFLLNKMGSLEDMEF